MARPRKTGLDYFPFDCDFFNDRKMIAISGEFGIGGEIVTVKLLCEIYSQGYYVEWDELLKFKLAHLCQGVTPELIERIVNRLLSWGFFDNALFETANILTSVDIQERYFNIAKYRVTSRNLPYLLLDPIKNYTRVENQCEKQVSSSETNFSQDKTAPKSPITTVSQQGNDCKQQKTIVSQCETTISDCNTDYGGEKHESEDETMEKTGLDSTPEQPKKTWISDEKSVSQQKTIVSQCEIPVSQKSMPQIKLNKRKLNKRKDSERVLKKSSAAERSVASPALKEVEEFFQRQGFRSSASLFFNYYQSRGWKTGNAPVEDWQALACTWDEREKKPKQGGSNPMATSSLQDQLRRNEERKAREAAEQARQEAIENPDGLSPAESLAAFKRKHGLPPDASAAELYGKFCNPQVG